ncbi:carbohydrate ABC transporter permease [Saccharothrix deserti]|uniref:carbohydrate ABC transporter permease n=1 Tax=Saccharothrix deserti TaxID=2593674 RepID=UPI00131D4615|nr:sugar ABC transporter permease [Saccharothrix deserti]
MVNVDTASRPPRAVRPDAAPRAAPGRRSRRVHGAPRLSGLLFTAPFLVGFALVFLVPFGYALYQSAFVERKSGSGFGRAVTEFVGVDNYVRGLSDPVFWQATFRVVVFAVVQIPVMLLLALVMALLLDAVTGRKTRYFRLGLLIPYMIPLMVGSLIWLYLYSPRLGPLTDAGRRLGLELDFFSVDLLWYSIGNLLTWGHVGFNMLILYSALRAVPRELFEAARIDGASELRIALSIKVPYVRGTVVLTGMLSIIGMLQIFAEPTVFRVTSPETVTSNFTPIMMIFNQAFKAGNYNYAAALSVILAIVVGAASALFYRLGNRTQS